MGILYDPPSALLRGSRGRSYSVDVAADVTLLEKRKLGFYCSRGEHYCVGAKSDGAMDDGNL